MSNDTVTMEKILKAKEEMDKIPVGMFTGMKVIESHFLEPMEVIIVVGSEYARKMREQIENKAGLYTPES